MCGASAGEAGGSGVWCNKSAHFGKEPLMEWNKENLKGLLLVVCGGVAFYCALQNLPAVAAACGWLCT